MAEALPVYWYVIIAVLWLGYLALEGFDLGVGMLMQAWARDERRRRVLLNVIGPVWEGNEVWLITAIGAMFAAFPFWYASLLSTLYLPMLLLLLALIHGHQLEPLPATVAPVPGPLVRRGAGDEADPEGGGARGRGHRVTLSGGRPRNATAGPPPEGWARCRHS